MRAHYGQQLKQAGGRGIPVSAEALQGTTGRGAGLTRSTVKLTAELVEAFAETYLAPKYDGRLPTPQFHREIWGACADDLKPWVLILAPRGHAKSTSVTEAYGLAALMFRQRDFAVIISNTLGQSVEFLRDVVMELTENEALIRDFEIHKLLKDTEDDVIVQFRDGHKFRIVARGSEQKVRGLKWNKRRPNLILCDDLEDDEQVSSKERREKFSRWFMRAVLPFGSDDCLFRVAATILHFDSLANNLSKDESWFTLRYKAHRSFGDFNEILWPEKFSEARLRGIQAKYKVKGDDDGYSQEYLNLPIAEGLSFFRPEDLQPMEEHHHKLALRKICAWDFAISEKTKADYTVCVVVGIDTLGRRFVVDVRRGRWASDEIANEMFSVQKAHRCEVHYAEGGQIEKTLAPFLYTKMREEDFYFNIEVRTPVKSKEARAAAWRAATRARQVWFDTNASWWDEFFAEMKQFPKGAHDDQVDPQSLIGMELEGLLSADTPEQKEREEYQELTGPQFKGRNGTTGY